MRPEEVAVGVRDRPHPDVVVSAAQKSGESTHESDRAIATAETDSNADLQTDKCCCL